MKTFRQKQAEALSPASYRAKRAHDYPKIGDQLDALHKAVQALASAGSVTLPDDYLSLLAKVQAVKQNHPKPE